MVTPDGVIATDPLTPKDAKQMREEIRKVTDKPVKYLVYSHHHYDHIAGGKPFKEAGATVCVGTWPPALGIFQTLLRRGKLDEAAAIFKASATAAKLEEFLTLPAYARL